jgi:hypothetical protein
MNILITIKKIYENFLFNLQLVRQFTVSIHKTELVVQ